MSGTNPVATWTDPVNTSQDAATYKAALDGAALIAKRLVDAFAPRQSVTPNMTVTLDAGAVLNGITLTEVALQVSATIVAPTGSNKRIDRVVVDATTGAVSVITGTPTTGTPAAPALTAGKLPVAQVGTVASPLLVSTTAITNSMLVDERSLLGAAILLSIGSNVQAWSAQLDSLAALASNGLVARTAANTVAARTLTGTANQVTVTNGDGVSGNPTLSLPSAITLPGSLTMGGLLDLGSTGQIQFPATQNASVGANVLDDYEEGTWTLSLGGTATYFVQSGNYTKVGNSMRVRGSLSVNAIGTGSTTTFSGLPFTIATLAIFVVRPLASATAIVSAVGVGASTSTSISIQSRTAASASDSGNAIFANSTSLDFSGTYDV